MTNQERKRLSVRIEDARKYRDELGGEISQRSRSVEDYLVDAVDEGVDGSPCSNVNDAYQKVRLALDIVNKETGIENG